MTQRESKAPGGVARAVPGSDSARLTEPRPSGSGPDSRGANRALLWEELFQTATPSQQEEMLALAGRQGFLYADQVPASGGQNGKKLAGPPADNSRLRVLANVLKGDSLPPVR